MFKSRSLRVYMADVEVVALPGSDISKSGALGGYAYCFIPAKSKSAAMERLNEQLAKDRYGLEVINYFGEYQGTVWETPQEQNLFDSCSERCLLENAVVYGPINTWQMDSSAE